MALTVVGVFDNASEAQQAVEALVSDGFSRSTIDLSTTQSSSNSGGNNTYSGTNTYGSGDVIPDRHQNTSGTMAEEVVDDTKDTGSSIGNFFSSLFGMDDDNTNRYSQVAERSSIVTVHAQTEDEAERAADILDDNGAIDVDERASQYGNTSVGSGTVGSGLGYANTMDTGLNTTGVLDNTTDANYGTTGLVDNTTDVNYSTADTDRLNTLDNTGDQTIKVVEENLEVGKRQVETGGVRVRSRIVERPVEESLRLREERVYVQRNPVNRPATDADLTTFQEGEIELHETAERAVVSKTANVVEEISIGKEVNEREEVIRDTVRSTEVDVENLGTTDQTLRTDQSTFGTDSTNNITYRDNDARNL
ncbi:MAG TPA: YsnF/AvaK domain-containing protein [Fibrella sp.]